MTFKQWAEDLDQVSYKPGWRFELHSCEAGIASLEIQAPVTNSWPPYETTTIAFSFFFHVDEYQHRNRFFAFVRASVERVEAHEAREWFRVYGAAWPTSDHSTF